MTGYFQVSKNVNIQTNGRARYEKEQGPAHARGQSAAVINAAAAPARPPGEYGQQMSMGEVLEPLRRDSTPERIATQLRSGIVSGRLPPGQALREVEIARQLGVSRGPVREAFQRLIQEGLLEAHPARGVFVPQLTADDIADLYLARSAVSKWHRVPKL